MMMYAIPLAISSLSLVLSIFNVVFDFAGKMSEAECEKRIAEAIQARCARDTEIKRKQADDQHKEKLADIEKQYQAKVAATPHQDTQHTLWKQTQISSAGSTYTLALQALNQSSLGILETELQCYRQKLERIYQIMNGKTAILEQGDQHMAMAIRLQKAKADSIKAINDKYIEDLERLNQELRGTPAKPAAMDGVMPVPAVPAVPPLTPTEYTAKKDQLTADFNLLLQAASN